jgi:Family of unknown function (DUF5947)
VSEDTAAAPLAVLQRLRAARPRERARPGERCDLCTEELADEHGHLVDLEARSLLCACRGCHLLFESAGSGGLRYRAVPDRYVAVSDLPLTPGQWDALQIPVSVAFLFVNSTLDRVAAFYPSPAGATESLLPLAAMDDLISANAALADLQPDVEAILVRAAPGRGNAECFLVPIDACYELVGHMRRLWRGFDGGREANDALDEFFDRVRARAR